MAWGADVNAETQGRQTPLHLAAFCGNSRDTLQLLLMHPDLRPLSFNCQHDTPRDIALRQAFIFVPLSHVGFHIPSFTCQDICFLIHALSNKCYQYLSDIICPMHFFGKKGAHKNKACLQERKLRGLV